MEATLKQQKIPVYIEDEMRQSFMDYAMSVIISRALPDVRDGLKPRCPTCATASSPCIGACSTPCTT